MNFFSANFLQVNVYFKILNIESQTTSSASSFVALLLDIGGQLGLFLDVSAISIMEFGTWVVDEIKNQLFEDSASHQSITTEIPLSSAIPIMSRL